MLHWPTFCVILLLLLLYTTVKKLVNIEKHGIISL